MQSLQAIEGAIGKLLMDGKYGPFFSSQTDLVNADLFRLGLDSLKFMELVVDLEDLFEVEFQPEELVMEKMKSVASIAALVLLHLKVV